MFVVIATGPRAQIEPAADLLDALGILDAVGWFEIERKRYKLEAYASTEEAAQAAVGALALALPELEARLAPIEEADWVKLSLEGLPPVRAGRFFVCGGHDMHRAPAGATTIRIEAGEAFGTGHHGTTKGCLLALERLLRRGVRPRRVLDMGAGSAVLAIAAARHGAHAIAAEIDPRAAAVGAENIPLNGVRGRCVMLTSDGFKHDRIRASAPYDLVFANILLKPLIRLSGELSAALAPGGRLVLSGILSHQEPGIVRAFTQKGLTLEDRRRLEGWMTLTWRR